MHAYIHSTGTYVSHMHWTICVYRADAVHANFPLYAIDGASGMSSHTATHSSRGYVCVLKPGNILPSFCFQSARNQFHSSGLKRRRLLLVIDANLYHTHTEAIHTQYTKSKEKKNIILRGLKHFLDCARLFVYTQSKQSSQKKKIILFTNPVEGEFRFYFLFGCVAVCVHTIHIGSSNNHKNKVIKQKVLKYKSWCVEFVLEYTVFNSAECDLASNQNIKQFVTVFRRENK